VTSLPIAITITLLTLSIVGCTASPTTTHTTGPNGEEITTTVVDKETTVRTKYKTGRVSETGKDGTSSVGGDTEVSETELGLSYYPGSIAKPNGVLRVESNTMTNFSTIRLTDDVPDAVTSFYCKAIQTPIVYDMSDTERKGELVSGFLQRNIRVSISSLRKNGVAQTEIAINVQVMK